MTRNALCVLLLCLPSSLALSAETTKKKPPPDKPVVSKLSPQVQKLLDEGRKLFEAGKFKKALVPLEKAFEEDPGNLSVNWFLGRAAYETKDYETAVMTFERMLVLQPEAQRVRLELGRSYFMLGLHGLAKEEFVKVLDQNPPAAVQQNIRKFMELIEKANRRHYFSGMLNVSTSWDSNPLYSPGTDQIETVLGNVLLDQTVREDNDTFQAATLALQHKYRLGDRGFFLKSSAILYGTMYDEQGDQNVMFANGRTGLAFETEKLSCELAFQYSHLTKDDEEYINIHGVSVSTTRAFTPKVIGSLAFRFDNKDYEEPLDYKDAETRDVSGRLAVLLGKNRFFPNIGYEVEDARHAEESFKNLHLGLACERDLPWDFVAGASYGFKQMDYDKKQGIFGVARFDEIHDVAVSLTKKLGKHFEIQVSHAWTEAQSNINLYEFDRRIFTVGATFKF
jgi:Surface lipoprotein assembly modifier/Tetratricopeptide repeat